MPSMPDLKNKLTTVVDRAPAALTSDTQGTGASWADHEVGVWVQLQIGATVGTTPALVVQLQQSSNDNTADASGAADAYTDVTGATVTLSDTDASSAVSFMAYNYDERFLRLDYDITGTSASFVIGATISANKKS
jgi:hypothetical protein